MRLVLVSVIIYCAGAESVAAEGAVAPAYPVPVPPGGRFDVHGWLILPMDQEKPTESLDNYTISAWFSHHVPELFEHSPHNFQIILKGQLKPLSCVAGEIFPFEIPYPPADDLLTFGFSFTPPSPFSLNDLLRGDITHLRGVYYNGSFDTPYERQPTALAMLDVEELTTAVYLDEFEKESFQYLQYLSYPRGGEGSNHFYFAHEIHAQPDFDHVVHGTVTDCVDESGVATTSKEIFRPGSYLDKYLLLS